MLSIISAHCTQLPFIYFLFMVLWMRVRYTEVGCLYIACILCCVVLCSLFLDFGVFVCVYCVHFVDIILI
jgi:hypothetical protein